MANIVRNINLGPEFDIGSIQANKIRLKLGDGLTIAPDGTISAIAAQIGYSVFPIWAEESGTLASNNRQWSFGNGATGNINIPMPDCEVFAISFEAEIAGTSVSIELMKNNVSEISELFTGISGYNTLTTPISFSEGDLLGFRTDVETGDYSDARVAAWCRIPLLGLKGEKGDTGLDGMGGAPNAYAKINIPAATNINATNTDIILANPILDTIGVTVASNQLTLPVGTYTVKLILNITSTVQRPNQSISLFKAGALESTEFGEGYIRSTGGHNEAKITHTDIVVSSGETFNYTTSPISAAGVVGLTNGKLLIHKIA